MPALVRMLLLFFMTVGLALPMVAGVGTLGSAEAASRPCPSKLSIKACALETPSDALTPRGTTTVDATCHGKAIGVETMNLAAPTACAALAFDMAPASWSVWTPPTPARPPRS